MYEPSGLTLHLAVARTKREMESAEPHAPVLPDANRLRRIRRSTHLRSTLAGVLSRAARALEPPAYRTTDSAMDCRLETR